MNKTTVEIKLGTVLTENEISFISDSKYREWNTPPIDDEQKREIFVIVKDYNRNIAAHGQLLKIQGVKFDNKTFDIIGVGGILASIKGKGYGKLLMQIIVRYLETHDYIGIAFTGIPQFYEKFGFVSDKQSISQLVHYHGKDRVTNTTDEYVTYFDPKEQIVKDIFQHPKKEVILPRFPDW